MTKMKTLQFLEKEQGMIHQAPQEEEGDPRQVPKEAEVVTPLGEMITTAGTATGSFTAAVDGAATTLLHQEGEGQEEMNSGM